MSSNTNIGKYNIVLLQCGLGESFKTMEKLSNLLYELNNKLFIEFNYNGYKTIDMSNYSAVNLDFVTDLRANKNSNVIKGRKDFIDKSIFNLVLTSIKNENKFILVPTELSFTQKEDIGGQETVKYANIDAQSIRLKYIIDKIYEYENDINVFLIGHSQGGLVNLQVSNDDSYGIIKKVISISTPYSKVELIDANKMGLCIDALMGIFLHNDKTNNDYSKENLRDCIYTLLLKYKYETLKEERNKLTNKASIINIIGGSGLALKKINSTYSCNVFDGLVSIYEQNNIDAKHTYLFIDDVPCKTLNKYLYLHKECSKKNDIVDNCVCGKCPLDKLIYNDCLDELLSSSSNLYEEISLASYNKDYYSTVEERNELLNIYKHNYSHGFLRYNNEVLIKIIYELTN